MSLEESVCSQRRLYTVSASVVSGLKMYFMNNKGLVGPDIKKRKKEKKRIELANLVPARVLQRA